ncbi:formin-binding protein 1-like [Alosa sapidissima]|uniref:formin-binding protein 1-like n=1 Tax=Alosa sapidissima TaxID=34773 RepID=UPI001C0841F1|nr:formin-binding protein 1-like [Alosa sapidissima]
MDSNRGLLTLRRNGRETMNCSWGTELWDQFDNLEKHTQWGIEFVERYTKFVKERSEIELNYAKQIRNLSKKYQPKKNSREEEEYKYSSCRAFLMTLNELNDYAGQHEVIAENLNTQILSELLRHVQELKAERKSVSLRSDWPAAFHEKLMGLAGGVRKERPSSDRGIR